MLDDKQSLKIGQRFLPRSAQVTTEYPGRSSLWRISRWTVALSGRAATGTANPLPLNRSRIGTALPAAAREPVDDEAVVPVVQGEAVTYGRLDQVVADELPFRHQPAYLRTQFRVVLYVPPEDVADPDVYEVQVVREQPGLGTLAAA